MIARVLTIGSVLLLASSLSHSFDIRDALVADLPEIVINDCSKMQPKMVELNEALISSTTIEDACENIDVAKAILKNKWEGNKYQNANIDNRVLDLYISLEDASEKCNIDGYAILARNLYAIKGLEKSDVDRVYMNFEEYALKHARTCESQYKLRFSDHRSWVPFTDSAKIEKSFADLNGDDLALSRIVFNVVQQVKETPEWDSLKSTSPSRPLSNKKLNKMFDEYLFDPCKKFVSKLSDTLVPARFVASIFRGFGKKQTETPDDADYYKAMRHYGFCASLIEDQEKLYKPLGRAWDSISSDF